MMQPLFKAGREQVTSGLFPDLAGTSGPFWSTGLNADFDLADVKPVKGAGLFLPSQDNSPVVALHSQRAWGSEQLIWATGQGIYEYRENQTTKLQENTDTSWWFESWGNWTVGATKTGKLKVRSIEGGGFVEIDDAPAGFSLVSRRSPYLVLAGSSDDPTQIAWCHIDDIYTWTPTAENHARKLPIREMSSGITAVLEFRGELLYFGPGPVAAVSYIGYPYYFGAEKIGDGAGVYGPRAVCEANGLVYGIGPQGFWKSDGTQIIYLDISVIRNFIYDNLVPGLESKITLVHDRGNNRVLCFLPWEGSENSGAVVWNYGRENWSILDYGITSGDRGNIFGTVVGGTAGEILSLVRDVTPVVNPKLYGVQMATKMTASTGYGEFGYGEFGYGGDVL